MQLQTLFRKVPVFRTLIFYLIFIVKIEVFGAYFPLKQRYRRYKGTIFI